MKVRYRMTETGTNNSGMRPETHNAQNNNAVASLAESVIDTIEGILPYACAVTLIAAFLNGAFGVPVEASESLVVNGVWALFKYPSILIEYAAGILFAVLLLAGLVYDITSRNYEYMLPQMIAGIFAFCILWTVVLHVGSVVAGSLLFIFLAGLGLTVVGTIGVVVVSNGMVVFEGLLMSTSIFAEALAVIVPYLLAVAGLSVLVDTFLSFF